MCEGVGCHQCEDSRRKKKKTDRVKVRKESEERGLEGKKAEESG